MGEAGEHLLEPLQAVHGLPGLLRLGLAGGDELLDQIWNSYDREKFPRLRNDAFQVVITNNLLS